MDKNNNYYQSKRDEITSLIQYNSSTRVLDVGCAAGQVGNTLKSKGCGEVIGIEVIEAAAIQAEKIYDKVYVADIDSFQPPFESDYFDYIICADVLEHLKDPWIFLKKIKKHLKPDGCIITSLPNIRHRVIISELLRGNFDYRDSGIMDNTHLRFFTFNTILKLFNDTGYTIESIGPSIPEEADETIKLWKQNSVQSKISEIVKIFTNIEFTPNDDDLRDLFTLQFILKAKKNP